LTVHNENKTLISAIIPCRNELPFIERCLISIFNQKNLPGDIEVIVVDGNSTDGTREKLDSLKRKFLNLIVLDNPRQVTPVALNLGIKKAMGKYIAILGAHSEYSDTFFINALKLLDKYPDADCVGGPIISKGKSLFGKSTALAMSSFIGVGNAKHRFPEYEGYAEMACFPVFRREVFKKIGLYDEKLIKNQDDEFCFRLNRAGGRVFISPTVKSEYYVRDSVGSLLKQYYQYGYWRAAVIKKHRLPISFRQLVPSIFFLGIVVILIFGYTYNLLWLTIILPAIYLLALVTSSISFILKAGFKIAAILPLSIIILHFSYAVGTIYGLLHFCILSKET
jgi:GT2 family glycosyltransferase